MRDGILDELKNGNPHKFLEHKLLETIPYVFNGDLSRYLYWKSRLSAEIKVDSKAILLIGSSCLGFSINPNKNFKLFDKDSDIDVAIISQYFFDVSWRHIRNIGSEYHSFSPTIKVSIKDHIERLIYWGTIATDKILTILPFNREWINAANSMKAIEPTIDRVINFRIYRDFESLRAYQIHGLKKLQLKLQEE